MDQQWTLKLLLDWAVSKGLRAKSLGNINGVIAFLPDDEMPLFTITLMGPNDDFQVVIAINRKNERGFNLQEILQEKYDVTEYENTHKWPRFNLPDYDPSVLEAIADWTKQYVSVDVPSVPAKIVASDMDIAQNQEEKTEILPDSLLPPDKKKGLDKWLSTFLSQRGLQRPDGRPLYAYITNEEEYRRIEAQLKLVALLRGHNIFRSNRKFDALFVLFAAEWWRREYRGGPWAWAPIFKAIGLDDEAISSLQTSPQYLLYPALERGFLYWGREIFTMGQGRAFIGSIAAEGGLPLNLLNDSGTGLQRFFKNLLNRYLPVRASGIPASQIASELQKDLPESFRRETVYRVAGGILETVLNLRSQYALAEHDDPIAHLDKVNPEWRKSFSLSMDDEPAQVLLRALVVEAAKNSETGVPISLNRCIYAEFDGKYRLQAFLDIPRKVSTDSLALFFGNIEWPNQLEIWLIKPFKRRLAVLSRINNDHFKVRNEGVSWRGLEAMSEAVVSLFSYGEVLGEMKTLPESLMEDTLPWVFVEKDNHLQYLGQGGMSLAAESVTVSVPTGMELLSEESSVDNLGEIQDVGRTIYQCDGIFKVCSEEGEFTIRTRQPRVEIIRYELKGIRLYKDANVRQVFLGAPRPVLLNSHNTYDTATTPTVLWRPAGSGGEWLPWSPAMQGIVYIKVMDGNEVLFHSRVAVLAKETQIKLRPGADSSSGEIIVTNLPGVRFATVTEGINISVSAEQEEEVRLTLMRSDHKRTAFSLQIQWPNSSKPLELLLPVPVAGAQFRDADGFSLEDKHLISVHELAGFHAVGYNHSDGAEVFSLDIDIKANDLRARELRTLSDHFRLPKIGQISEVPLIQLRERFLQLFSMSEDLDCRLELTLRGKGTYGRLQLARYTHQLDVEEDIIALNSSRYRGTIDQSVVENLRLEAHSLLNPIEHGRELTPCLTEGVPTGNWILPQNLSPGSWLVMPMKGQVSSVRPTILGMPDYAPSENGRLRDAIAIADAEKRSEQISACITKMVGQYDHKDWSFVFETLDAFKHLPATTMDLWDCFARDPRAMAMLLITADEKSYQHIIDLANELPFVWELVPLNAWFIALAALSDFIKSSAPESMIDMLVEQSIQEKLKYIIEADDLLKNMTLVLTELVLGKSVVKLDEAKLLAVPGIIEKVLTAASNELRGGHDADVQWPEFHGELCEQMSKGSPDLVSPLFTQQAHYMRSVLHAPVAIAMMVCSLPSDEFPKISNTDLFELQQIRQFDEHWYKEAFSLTVLYLYAKDLLFTESINETDE